jgi:hypothetical protein
MPQHYYHDNSVTLVAGDATASLAAMPDASADCVVTSPLYWGLRDYGTGQWVDGNPDCPHLATAPHPGTRPQLSSQHVPIQLSGGTASRNGAGDAALTAKTTSTGWSPPPRATSTGSAVSSPNCTAS